MQLSLFVAQRVIRVLSPPLRRVDTYGEMASILTAKFAAIVLRFCCVRDVARAVTVCPKDAPPLADWNTTGDINHLRKYVRQRERLSISSTSQNPEEAGRTALSYPTCLSQCPSNFVWCCCQTPCLTTGNIPANQPTRYEPEPMEMAHMWTWTKMSATKCTSFACCSPMSTGRANEHSAQTGHQQHC